MSPPVRRIGVVVPAHDEAARIAPCLDALMAATGRVAMPVSVVVVLDACADDTAEVCARYPVSRVATDVHNVGRARHIGALHHLGGEDEPSAVWLANTDADTEVPPDWLVDQVRLADQGADVVAGLVALSDAGRTEPLVGAFADDYRRKIRAASHDHVHGANLGVRASSYLAIGGFPPTAAHEDRRLLHRLETATATRVVRTTAIVVRTSARLAGRCQEGFAATLRSLTGVPAVAEP